MVKLILIFCSICWLQFAFAIGGIDSLMILKETELVNFNFDELKNMKFRLKVEVGASSYWSELASIETLDRLLQQEAITFKQYLERIPVGLITQKQSLLEDIKNKDIANPTAQLLSAVMMLRM